MHIIRKLELETESGPKSTHSDFMGVKHSKWGRAIKTCLKNILNSHKFFQVVHVIFCRTANDLIWILEHYWKFLSRAVVSSDLSVLLLKWVYKCGVVCKETERDKG